MSRAIMSPGARLIWHVSRTHMIAKTDSSTRSRQQRAAHTDRWTETLFRALSNRVAERWRFVSFRGLGGGEWRGVVDVLAVRKNTARSDHHVMKSGDLFDIMLIQMKGGSARPPSPLDIRRLRAVKRRYRASGIVLFSWKRQKLCTFQTLEASGKWSDPVRPADLFGERKPTTTRRGAVARSSRRNNAG